MSSRLAKPDWPSRTVQAELSKANKARYARARMRAFVVPVSVLVSVCCFASLGCTASEDPLEPYVYADELEPIAGLGSPRFAHAASSLADGRVLLAGGILGAPSQLDWDAFVAEVELFDPATEEFELGPALEFPRVWASATRVADGRVVVLGGTTLDANTQSIPALAVEVWDPADESISTIGELPSPGVLFHCAVPIDSKVLVIDECYPGSCTPLLVDPSTGVSALGGDPSYRYGLNVDCAPLGDGRVLLAGGVEVVNLVDVPSDYAEIYDPQTESFELVGPMPASYGPKSRLVALATGDVLILGAATDDSMLGQVYSPATDSFTPVTGSIVDRAEHTLTLLADGRVLISGGVDAQTLEPVLGLDLFDPTDNSLSVIDPSFAARTGHTAVLLDAGPVLFAGGQDATGFRMDASLFR